MRDVATPFMLELASVRKPVIAQVNGIAAGAGFSIVMACDFRITAENGSFLSAFIRIGLIPDSGLHYFLPRAVGLTRATEIMTLGEIIPAKKALEWGKSIYTFDIDSSCKWSILHALCFVCN